MSKHLYTPPPWRAVGRDIIIGDGKRIAKAQTELRYGVKIPIEEALSNARLMAAAPELLEACKLLVEFLEERPNSHSGNGKLWEVLIRAIAKAGLCNAQTPLCNSKGRTR